MKVTPPLANLRLPDYWTNCNSAQPDYREFTVNALKIEISSSTLPQFARHALRYYAITGYQRISQCRLPVVNVSHDTDIPDVGWSIL